MGAPTPAEERAILDLTGLPRPQRHRAVIAALEALDPGTRLVVVNDHEPHGLRIQLQRRYPAGLLWESRGGAGERFVVAIRLEEPRPRAPLLPAATREPRAAETTP